MRGARTECDEAVRDDALLDPRQVGDHAHECGPQPAQRAAQRAAAARHRPRATREGACWHEAARWGLAMGGGRRSAVEMCLGAGGEIELGQWAAGAGGETLTPAQRLAQLGWQC